MCWRKLKSIVEVHCLAELISNHGQVDSTEKWLSRSRTGLKLSERDVFVSSGHILITSSVGMQIVSLHVQEMRR